MTHMVFCQKQQQTLPGLDSPPYPNELGQKIYDNISQQAWDAWINHQTMLINEYRLNLLDLKSKQFLLDEMDLFLFGTGSAKPPGYEPQD